MGLLHLVLVEFKAGTEPEAIQEGCQRMLALKEQCVHPTTEAQYIKSATGGRDNSPEGLSAGFTHAFMIEFDNEEDRKYYLHDDPAHLAFKKSVGSSLAKVQVMDFEPAVF